MESINKLRDFLKGTPLWRCVDFRLDEIEREIEEKYMELPLDMNGVPIRECDVIQFVNAQGGTGVPVKVYAVSKHYAYYGDGKHFYKASDCRHAKPDLVKELLRDYCVDIAHQLEADPDKTISESTIADYAERIRKAVES